MDGDELAREPGASVEITSDYRLVYSFYSLSPEAARDLLQQGLSTADLYTQVVELTKTGSAVLERTQSLVTTNSGEATVRDTAEYKVPGAYSADGSETPPSVKAEDLKSRNVGLTITIKPTVKSNLCNLAHFPEWTEFLGYSQQGGEIGRQIQSPIFRARRTNSRLYLEVGKPQFFSTYSPPMHTGVAEADTPRKVWLAFVGCFPAKS